MKRKGMFGFLILVFVVLSLGITDPSAYAKPDSRGSSRSGSAGGGRAFVGGGRTETPRAASVVSSNKFIGGGRPAQTTTTPEPERKPNAFQGGGRPAVQTSSPAPAAPKPNAFVGGGRDGQVKAQAAPVPSQNQPTVKKSPFEEKMGQQVSAERSKAALETQRAQQAKFKLQGSPVSASPTTTRYVTRNVYVNNYHYTPAGYAYRQNSFYTYYHWSPPIYGYGFHPYYGMWNTVALWFMLDRIHDQQYAMMYYSHRNDPDMMAWRQKAEIEAQTNADLRQKLAAADERARQMEQQGIQKDPGYIPPDMKDVALSEETLKNAEQQSLQAQVQQQAPQAMPVAYSQPATPKSESHWLRWTVLAIIVAAGLVWWLL